MNLNVLVAYPKTHEDMWVPIKAAIRKGSDNVYQAEDQDDVLAKAQTGKWDAILSTLQLAKGVHSETLDERGGLNLFSSFQGTKTKTHLGLILPAENHDVSSKSRFMNPRPELFYHANLERDLVDYLRDLGPRAHCLEIVIHAHPQRGWKYEMSGDGFEFPTRSKRLKILTTHTEMWHNLSIPINSGTDEWTNNFNVLGKNLIGAFCETSKSFAADLEDGIKAAGNLANTRLTFAISTEFYPIALESIYMPNPPQPWVTTAPLIRTLSPKGTRKVEVFEQGAGFVRTLVLCANVDGYVDMPNKQRAMRFMSLPRAADECALVSKLFNRAAMRDLPVKKPVTIGTPTSPLTPAYLKDLLAGSWDIIHFAGHAHFEEDQNGGPGRGYLILESGRPGELAAVEISEIAPQLSKAKLLYLSSCRSASARFAQEAAKHGVPAIIGFSAPVGDRFAYLCARRFYLGLIGRRTIDAAFLGARRSLYKRMPKNNTWASGVLVMGRRS